jgi:carboxyl-terminal processing protease
MLQDDGVTPSVLVASKTDDQVGAEDDSDGTSTSTATTPEKPAVQVDEQLTKALDILKAKTA